MDGAGSAGNALVDQGAAEVVGSGIEAELGELGALLDPRDLYVGDPVVEHQSRYGVHFQHLAARGPGSNILDQALLVHGRLPVYEAERNELGEAAGLHLDVPQKGEVSRLVPGVLDVAVHDGGAGGDAQAMRRCDHADPVGGADPAGRDNLADAVVQDLGGGARQAVQAGVFEQLEVLLQRRPRPNGAVEDFLGGEGVDVDIRSFLLDGAADIDVEVAVHLWWQARLNADLGRSEVPGLPGPAHQLLDGQEIGFLLAMASTEGTEAAALDADVGEVDVAVYDVVHYVTDGPASKLVGCEDEGVKRRAFGLEQDDRFLRGDVLALQALVEDAGHRRVDGAEHALPGGAQLGEPQRVGGAGYHRSSSLRT